MTPITIVQTLPEQQWRQFVDQHPNGNIFHTPEMYEVFRQTLNHTPELWAAVNGEQVLALLLPVRVSVLPGVLRRLTTRAVAYGSVLYAPGQAGQDGLAQLLLAYRQSMKRTAVFIELRNLHDIGSAQQILGSCQYTFVDYLDYLVDTSVPVDQVWNNIHKSAQRKITKALTKRQFDVIEAQEASQIEICYRILKQTYANAQVPLADYSLFKAAFDILAPKGMVKFQLGQADGQAVAASVGLLYKDVIYGWYRGFDRAYASYYPNDLMVWDTLKWGAEHQFSTFDFGGAGKPGEEYGPRTFKAKFGGKEVNYGRNICVYSTSVLRISQWGYELLRHLAN